MLLIITILLGIILAHPKFTYTRYIHLTYFTGYIVVFNHLCNLQVSYFEIVVPYLVVILFWNLEKLEEFLLKFNERVF